MNVDTPEVNGLLESQKTFINKANEQRQLLLQSANAEISEFNNVKQALGWDDTDSVLHEETRKSVELSQRLEQHTRDSILSQDTVDDYCIRNNYALCRLSDYKGRISEELLKLISNYCKANDMALRSDANLQSLYILCRFVDTNADNQNLKKAKRYKGELPKLIILHKLDNSNAYHNNHYKVIGEKGTKLGLFDFVNSVFKTHTSTLNHLRAILLYGSIVSLFYIVFMIMGLAKGPIGGLYDSKGLDYCILIVTGILIVRIFLPTIDGNIPVISYWRATNYQNDISTETRDMTRFCTSYQAIRTSSQHIYSIKVANKIREKVHISFWAMTIGLFIVLTVMLHSVRVIVAYKGSKYVEEYKGSKVIHTAKLDKGLNYLYTKEVIKD